MPVEQVTTFTIQDLSSISVQCQRCGASMELPLTMPAEGSGAPSTPRRHPLSSMLGRQTNCPCGYMLWDGPGEDDPTRELIRALIDARRQMAALINVRLNAPSALAQREPPSTPKRHRKADSD